MYAFLAFWVVDGYIFNPFRPKEDIKEMLLLEYFLKIRSLKRFFQTFVYQCKLVLLLENNDISFVLGLKSIKAVYGTAKIKLRYKSCIKSEWVKENSAYIYHKTVLWIKPRQLC